MDLGLIQDAVLIGAYDRAHLMGLSTVYTDVLQQPHRIYDVNHIWLALDANGWLTDAAQAAQYQPVWDILGWVNNAGNFSFLENRDALCAFVLDFDLDYFTTPGPTGIGQLVWQPEQVRLAFGKTFNHGRVPAGFRPVDFLQLLTTYSYAITIARESPYCGGYRPSAQILEMLDSMLFKGQLTTRYW